VIEEAVEEKRKNIKKARVPLRGSRLGGQALETSA
jgi:hypothetical protein